MDNKTLVYNPSEYGIKSYISYRYNLLIVCEDSSNGMEFYFNAVKTLYQDLKFTIISSHGFGGFERTIDSIDVLDKFTNIILIFDSGANDKSLDSISTQLRNIVIKHPEICGKTIIFKPKAFEEVLFSFINLDKIADIHGHKLGFTEFNQFRHNNIVGISNGELYREFKNDHKTIERAFETLLSQLTVGTKYHYSHGGTMSKCWINDCCYRDYKLDCERIPLIYPYSSKIDLISRQSKLFGLTAIIDKMLGYKYRSCEISIEAIIDCLDML